MAHAWDIARFARERLGFEADPVQTTITNARVHRGLLNCTRQWGKSTITAIMAVHRALVPIPVLRISILPLSSFVPHRCSPLRLRSRQEGMVLTACAPER